MDRDGDIVYLFSTSDNCVTIVTDDRFGPVLKIIGLHLEMTDCSM